MEGIIKVSPEQLAATASEFGGQATQLQTLTAQMMDLIKSLSASWNGEASQAYLAKFQGLQPDMDKMFKMIQEHSTDLQEMAAAYCRRCRRPIRTQKERTLTRRRAS